MRGIVAKGAQVHTRDMEGISWEPAQSGSSSRAEQPFASREQSFASAEQPFASAEEPPTSVLDNPSELDDDSELTFSPAPALPRARRRWLLVRALDLLRICCRAFTAPARCSGRGLRPQPRPNPSPDALGNFVCNVLESSTKYSKRSRSASC